MTTVLMNVAKSALIPATPTFAKIAVSAKAAERTAQSCHERFMDVSYAKLRIRPRALALQNRSAIDAFLLHGSRNDPS
jgi:hypothetical protein